MTAEERILIIGLIRSNVIPSDYKYYWSSYALKEVFEKLSGCYISNENFKELMRIAGNEPTRESSKGVNYFYKIEIKPNPKISRYFWGRGCQGKYIDYG